ncbi:hypothetical protein [Paenibacillus polymyxa]|uniref:hypothetical protein n=1 Tax=Paenibacillus polymyxa TaxID=1406 RepID=UPI001CA5DC1F|nr:hypothetical protein [Paenibacillus polymyxa]
MNHSSKSAVIRSEVNKLNTNKIWQGIKIALSLLVIFAIVALVCLLAIMLFTTLLDRNAIVNTSLINSLAIVLGILSLPGIVAQLVSMLVPEKKKKYIATTPCPHCMHWVDLRMREE